MLVNQALTRNRGGLFLRLDWAIGSLWVLHWFGWSSVGVWWEALWGWQLEPVPHFAKDLDVPDVYSFLFYPWNWPATLRLLQ